MKPKIVHAEEPEEFYTDERCYIAELINAPEDPGLSIARARVEPGVTTAWHRLKGIAERYIILSGRGTMEVQGVPKTEVSPGDLILIPSDTPQRVTNSGDSDLIFLCICTPGFKTECYLEGMA